MKYLILCLTSVALLGCAEARHVPCHLNPYEECRDNLGGTSGAHREPSEAPSAVSGPDIPETPTGPVRPPEDVSEGTPDEDTSDEGTPDPKDKPEDTPSNPGNPGGSSDEGTPDEDTSDGPKPGGQNPGNDKPVGNSPFDGERGEVPSGKPKDS